MPQEQQHYVPRFLLKNFTAGKKPKVWVFDKSNDNSFCTNIRNVAAEKGFYDLAVGDELFTYEPGLSKLEANASAAIRTILDTNTLATLNEKEFAVLAVFFAVQFVRTKEHRLRFTNLGKELANSMKDRGIPDAAISEFFGEKLSFSDEKVIGFESLRKVDRFVPFFLAKRWLLFSAPRGNGFYISDNPVVMHNDIDHGSYGNIGLGVTGIQIYVPLSSDVSIGILCPSITSQFENAGRNIEMLDSVAPGLADQTMKSPREVRQFIEGLKSGEAIPCSTDNLTMMNSLQVLFSSRFVYSQDNDFNLVKTMIKDDNCRRFGLQPTVS